MIIVIKIGPRLLIYPPDILFWGVKCRDSCEKCFVNSYLDLKLSFVTDPIDSVELDVRDVLDIIS